MKRTLVILLLALASLMVASTAFANVNGGIIITSASKKL